MITLCELNCKGISNDANQKIAEIQEKANSRGYMFSNEYTELVTNLNLKELCCPCCQRQELRAHGYYERIFSFKGEDGIMLESAKYKLRRVYCKHCHCTHVLLFTTMVPYYRLQVLDMIKVLGFMDSNLDVSTREGKKEEAKEESGKEVSATEIVGNDENESATGTTIAGETADTAKEAASSPKEHIARTKDKLLLSKQKLKQNKRKIRQYLNEISLEEETAYKIYEKYTANWKPRLYSEGIRLTEVTNIKQFVTTCFAKFTNMQFMQPIWPNCTLKGYLETHKTLAKKFYLCLNSNKGFPEEAIEFMKSCRRHPNLLEAFSTRLSIAF